MPIITPVPSLQPSATAPTTASQSAQSARERAIVKLMGGTANTQANPVANPSQVSPEELSAVQPPEELKAAPEVQKDSSETPPLESKEATEKTTKEEPLSAQFAQLARKEKAIRAKVQEVKAKEDALAAREAALQAKDTEYQTNYISKSRLLDDTIGVLNEAGLSYDQITSLMLNAPKQEDIRNNPAYKSLVDEVKALRADSQKFQKSAEDNQTAQYKQAVNQIRLDATKLVQNDPSFETIKETGSIGDVVELIEKTFKEDGILMSVEDAALAVEEHLVEEAMKITKIKKIQQRLAPPAPTPKAEPVETKPQPSPQQSQMKTLTNSVGATRQLTARERAILAFKGELRK